MRTPLAGKLHAHWAMPDEGNRREIFLLMEENLRLRRLLDEKSNGNGSQHKEDGDAKEDKKQDDKDGKKEEKKDEQPKPPLRRRALVWSRTHPLAVLAILAGTVVLVIVGMLFWNYLQSYESTDNAQVDGHINAIGSRIGGTVIAVYTENNRSVAAGQALVDLDPSDYKVSLAQAEANLAQAQAGLEAQAPNVPITETTESTTVATSQLEVANATAAVEAARRSHESAIADLRQTEASAQNAAAEELRYRQLVEKQEVSREQYDQRATAARAQAEMVASRKAAAEAAERAIAQRETELGQARARMVEAKNNQPRQVNVQHATVATRRANVDAARALLEQARLNLTYCKIAAPVAGIVGNKTVEVGQQVAPGQELLAITPVEDLWVTANFKETQIQRMHPGQGVTIQVDALNLKFDGWVQNMPGATGARYSLLPPENATGNYVKVVQRLPVRIRINTGQPGYDRLRPGMSVEPKVWLK